MTLPTKAIGPAGIVDPLAFDFGLDFQPVSERVLGEKTERITNACRALPYFHTFLDDYMRCIMPHDLILLGARSGVGKTQLAQTIAASNAAAGKRVHFFALEAEPNEIERRTKFSVIADLVGARSLRIPGGFNYPDWYCGRLERHLHDIDQEATELVAETYKTFHTYYRGSRFSHEDIRRLFLAIQDKTDLIVLDHLHYVDIEDDNENRGFKQTVKMIRDISIAIGKPVILVVHLRKADVHSKGLVPVLDDIHGSSDTSKICTNAVMIGHASAASLSACKYKTPKGYASTYFGIPKYRVGGATQLVALCTFDWRRRVYSDHYTLGYTSKNGAQFEPIGTDDVPSWAHHHQPLSVPFADAGEHGASA